MQIIIPMAGHSRRFKKAGYQTPKPFILIDHKPMIHWVCSMFSAQDSFFFIAQEEHLQKKEQQRILESAAPHHTLIAIPPHEEGPVYSALYAKQWVLKDEPIVVCYCDFYQHWDYEKFQQAMHGEDGGITVFRGFHPASFGDTYYAYIRSKDGCYMDELREKQSFTSERHQEFASSGVYYWRSWDLFEKYAEELMKSNVRISNEQYASLVFNPMRQNKLNIRIFEIENFICWGTPEDLEQYFFWSQVFQKFSQKRNAT